MAPLCLSWHWSDGEETYGLIEVRAPELGPPTLQKPHDIYFLADRSGSMEGAKWTQTCQALRAFIELLGPSDRVWISLFNDKVSDFAEAPLPPARLLADPGFEKLQRSRPNGGTKMLPAVRHVLEKVARHSAGRRTTLILITDGQVGNETELLDAFRATPEVCVHTFGIDTAVNDGFLKALARQQRGTCWLQTPNDDIAGTIAALGGRLRSPVLTHIRLEGTWESPVDRWPDLHAGEVLTVLLRGNGSSTPVLVGRAPDGTEHRMPLALDSAGTPAITLLWIKERIRALLDAGQNAEALELAKTHTLLCPGAAFVAWDESEKVAVAGLELVQPSLAPAAAAPTRTRRAAPGVFAPSRGGGNECVAFAPDTLGEAGPGLYRPDSQISGVIGFGPALPHKWTLMLSRWDDVALPVPLLELWFPKEDWSAAQADERYEQLETLVSRLYELRSLEAGWVFDFVGHMLVEGAYTAPPNFDSWAQNFSNALETTAAHLKALVDLGVPEILASSLLEWQLREMPLPGAGEVWALSTLVGALQAPGLTPEQARQLWTTFVTTHMAADPATAAEVAEWLKADDARLPGQPAVASPPIEAAPAGQAS